MQATTNKLVAIQKGKEEELKTMKEQGQEHTIDYSVLGVEIEDVKAALMAIGNEDADALKRIYLSTTSGSLYDTLGTAPLLAKSTLTREDMNSLYFIVGIDGRNTPDPEY